MNIRGVTKPELLRSEEELRLSRWMVEAQRGDSVSYRKLLTELNTMLEKYSARAVRRCVPDGDVSVALDVVQEVLLAIHHKRHTYDSTQRLLPWVFGIARHKLIDWQRKHFTERKQLDLNFEIEDVMAVDGQTSGDLQNLLGRLSVKQREVIELTKLQGLSVAETAEHLGLSEANVKVLTHRGISALRRVVEDHHV